MRPSRKAETETMTDASRKTGVCSAAALITGACIGSAILSISGVTILYAGPSAILSWLIAALIYGGYGMLVASLARRYPRSGGIYIFPKRAFGGVKGSFWGFISGWGYIVSNVIAIAFSAIFLGEYLKAGFPAMSSGLAASIVSCLAAAAILLAFPRRSGIIQTVLTGILVASLLIYCAFAFFGGAFDASAFNSFFTSGSKGATGFVSAVPLALVAYGGCLVVPFMASEVRNPSRTIPLSLALGLGAVALLYCSVLAAVTGTLPQSVLAGSDRLRYIPLVASVSDGNLAGWPWLLKLVSLSGVLALFTTIIALLRVNAKAMQVMAREGLMPKFLTRENRGGAPYGAVLILAAISVILCFFESITERLILLGALLNVISMVITIAAFRRIRRQEGGAGKLSILAVAGAVAAVCYIPDVIRGDAGLWIFTLAVYAAGLAVYLFYRMSAKSRLSGIVVHGKGHGHRHGMPTANLDPYPGESLPRYGVWATRVMLDNKVYYGLTNVGLRPSDDDSPAPTVETLILDFNNQIYGDEMMLEFVSYIRETMKFADLDELRSQVSRDIESVRNIIKN